MKRTFHLCPRCGSEKIALFVTNRQAREECPNCTYIANYVRFTPCNHCNPDAFGTCPHGDGGTPTETLCVAP